VVTEALILNPMVHRIVRIMHLFNTPKKQGSENIGQMSSYACQHRVLVKAVEVAAGLSRPDAAMCPASEWTNLPLRSCKSLCLRLWSLLPKIVVRAGLADVGRRKARSRESTGRRFVCAVAKCPLRTLGVTEGHR
jgi:hypothetical protein